MLSLILNISFLAIVAIVAFVLTAFSVTLLKVFIRRNSAEKLLLDSAVGSFKNNFLGRVPGLENHAALTMDGIEFVTRKNGTVDIIEARKPSNSALNALVR